jgi:hypothetical protein
MSAAISFDAKASGTRSSQQARKPTTRSPAARGMVMPAFMMPIAARASWSRFISSAKAAGPPRLSPSAGPGGRSARSSAMRRSMFSSRIAFWPPLAAPRSARAVAGSRKSAGGGPRLSRRR